MEICTPNYTLKLNYIESFMKLLEPKTEYKTSSMFFLAGAMKNIEMVIFEISVAPPGGTQGRFPPLPEIEKLDAEK